MTIYELEEEPRYLGEIVQPYLIDLKLMQLIINVPEPQNKTTTHPYTKIKVIYKWWEVIR